MELVEWMEMGISGKERNGTGGMGVDRSGFKGPELSGKEGSGMDRNGINGKEGSGLERIGMERIGGDWRGVDSKDSL